MRTPSVPFRVETVAHVRGGYALVRANGVARLEPDQLVLEFSGGAALIGDIVNQASTGNLSSDAHQQDVRSVSIPLGAIAELRTTGGFFTAPKLHIEVNRVAALAEIPWAEGPRCVLTFRRRDRGRLRELAIDVDMRLADAQLKELEGPA